MGFARFRSWFVPVTIVLGLLASGPVFAQQNNDTVFLKNGGRIRGNVLSEEPAVGVTVQLANGATRSIPAGNVRRVEYARSAATHVQVEPTAPASDARSAAGSSNAVVVDALMRERAAWQGRNTGLLAPVTFTAVGALGVGLAVFLFTDQKGDAGNDMVGGTLAAVVGTGSLVTGVVLWLLRTSADRQQQEIRRIDNQLRLHGVQANVTPWLVPKSRTSAAAGGLTLDIRF